jgi:histidinol-phosphatase (PHP family)
MAEKYTLQALKSECIFEVNTGLISRGFRSMACPHERLLKIIAKNGGRVTVSSDSHAIDTLTASFGEMKTLLREVGFKEVCTLKNGEWIQVPIE